MRSTLGLVAALVAAIFVGGTAWAQAITQSGPVTGGHVPMYIGGALQSGLASAMDSGPASGGTVGLGLSELLLQQRTTGTGPDGTNLCDWSTYATNPAGANYLCLSANALGGGLIDFNSPTGQPLQIKVNGVISQLPFTLSGATNFLTVAQFGAKCDGVTNDSPAFQSAINAAALASNPSGVVWVAPTGHACVLASGLMQLGGTHLDGAGGLNWTSPIDNTESDWTAKSSWLHCEDTVNPCISVMGNSSSVEGLNFWYTQPTPAGGNCGVPCTYTAYSPTVYPYTIYVAPTAQVGVWITNDSIANAYNGVDWEGPSSGVAGIYSGMDRDNICALGAVGTRFHMIDNALNLSRLRYECWWFQGNSQWWYAMQASGHTDWDVEYLANPQVNDVEFAFGGTAMRFNDACVTSGFGNVCFAVSDMQAKGVSFNEVCQAMTVTSTQTHVSARLQNVILYTDSTTSPVAGQCAQASPYALNLASDNANVSIDGLDGGFVQNLAKIGGGNSGAVHGQLHLANVQVANYSAYANGAVGVQTDSTGSFVMFGMGPLMYPSTTFSAGVICAGGGCASNSNSVIGNLEIGGVNSPAGVLYFSNIKQGEAPGFNLGTPSWDIRSDATAGYLYFDRSNPATGAFIDSPLYVVPVSTAANNTQVQITGQAVIHGGTFDVPILISALPACGPSIAGTSYVVSNGASPPTYNATVGTPGSSADRVVCNNTNWVYQ